MKLAKLYTVSFHMINVVWAFLIIKLHEEKSYRVSPNVASNFSDGVSRASGWLSIDAVGPRGW